VLANRLSHHAFPITPFAMRRATHRAIVSRPIRPPTFVQLPELIRSGSNADSVSASNAPSNAREVA
jgi:hypothetical protein